MNKLSLRLDVTKIDKTKIEDSTYQNKDGATVTEKNYNFELVPLKQEKVIKETADYTMVKVAFLADKSTKNEDGTYNNGAILGDAIEFRNGSQASEVKASSYNPATGEVNVDDIPF